MPTWFEHEAGPYITAGVIVAKDPETGLRNVSIARLRLEGGGRMMAGIARNHHLYMPAEKARAAGRKLEIAVAIGNHTAVLPGSQMYVRLGGSLIPRAADVVLKERRRLVLLFRETPLNLIHCRNMTAVTEAGAVAMPPVPAFYPRPKTVQEIVDHTAARALDLLGLHRDDVKRWRDS